eukprot:SAG31_NODE_3408_length_4306_cov_17.408129_2_plen_840_part_00
MVSIHQQQPSLAPFADRIAELKMDRERNARLPATILKFDGTAVNPRADIFIYPKEGGQPGELRAEFDGDVPLGTSFSTGEPHRLQELYGRMAIPLQQWIKAPEPRLAPAYGLLMEIDAMLASRIEPLKLAIAKAERDIARAEAKYSKRQMRAARAAAVALRGPHTDDGDAESDEDSDDDGESDVNAASGSGSESDDGDATADCAQLGYNRQQVRLLRVAAEVRLELLRLMDAVTLARKQLENLAPPLTPSDLHTTVPVVFDAVKRAINQQRVLANEVIVFGLELSDHSETFLIGWFWLNTTAAVGMGAAGIRGHSRMKATVENVLARMASHGIFADSIVCDGEHWRTGQGDQRPTSQRQLAQMVVAEEEAIYRAFQEEVVKRHPGKKSAFTRTKQQVALMTELIAKHYMTRKLPRGEPKRWQAVVEPFNQPLFAPATTRRAMRAKQLSAEARATGRRQVTDCANRGRVGSIVETESTWVVENFVGLHETRQQCAQHRARWEATDQSGLEAERSRLCNEELRSDCHEQKRQRHATIGDPPANGLQQQPWVAFRERHGLPPSTAIKHRFGSSGKTVNQSQCLLPVGTLEVLDKLAVPAAQASHTSVVHRPPQMDSIEFLEALAREQRQKDLVDNVQMLDFYESGWEPQYAAFYHLQQTGLSDEDWKPNDADWFDDDDDADWFDDDDKASWAPEDSIQSTVIHFTPEDIAHTLLTPTHMRSVAGQAKAKMFAAEAGLDDTVCTTASHLAERVRVAGVGLKTHEHHMLVVGFMQEVYCCTIALLLHCLRHPVDCLRHSHDCLRHTTDCLRHLVDCLRHSVDYLRHSVDCLRHSQDCLRHPVVS